MQVFDLTQGTSNEVPLNVLTQFFLRIKDFKILHSTYIGYNIGNYSFQGFLIILKKTTGGF